MNELQQINNQMSAIANFARAYANATPEQRANVSREDIQVQLDRYNQLKSRRNQLYAEQENQRAQQLQTWRQTQQQWLQWNYMPMWRVARQNTQAQAWAWTVAQQPVAQQQPQYARNIVGGDWTYWLVKPIIGWVQNRYTTPYNTNIAQQNLRWAPIRNNTTATLQDFSQQIANPNTYNQLLNSMDYTQWSS